MPGFGFTICGHSLEGTVVSRRYVSETNMAVQGTAGVPHSSHPQGTITQLSTSSTVQSLLFVLDYWTVLQANLSVACILYC